jgi:uncharacterized protein YvpB
MAYWRVNRFRQIIPWVWGILAGIVVLIVFLGQPAVGRAASLPEEALVRGVVGHRQEYTLSCESRSAVDWAAFWGVKIGERKFLTSLPRSQNPDLGFVGDPNGTWGGIPPASYGIHAKPVAAALTQLGLQAKAQKSMKFETLKAEIAAGRPVIVWVVGQMWPGKAVRVKLNGSKSVTVANFEHTMILVGYTPNTVTVVDAYSGQTQIYTLQVFMKSWSTLGRMAITGGVEDKASRQGQKTPLPAENDSKKSLQDIPRINKLYLPLVFVNRH